MKRKPTISKLKKKVWAKFSIYIRMKYADSNGFAYCVTCLFKETGLPVFWKELQAGHLVPGRTNSILFDERGVYPQCYRCNCCLNGDTLMYIGFMEKKHGIAKARKIIIDLTIKSKQTRSFTAEELIKLGKRYDRKIKKLQKIKHL